MLPALVALYKVASGAGVPETVRVQSALLLAVTWLFSLTSRLMLLRHFEWQVWYDRFQGIIWLGVLVFLIAEVRRVQRNVSRDDLELGNLRRVMSHVDRRRRRETAKSLKEPSPATFVQNAWWFAQDTRP